MHTALNSVDGSWRSGTGLELAVTNPATAEQIAALRSSTPADVDAAVEAGHKAFADWRRVPVTDRVQFLFRFKSLLEKHLDDLAATITVECGKTLAESRGELRRGIENVETACGMPLMLQGRNNEDVARDIDAHLFREPLGVVAGITPFNFPAMIPLWFLPYAIAAGNCFILKPSERVPLTAVRLFELLAETGLPGGVAQLILGGRDAATALVEHPLVEAVSFVGSTPAARAVYARAAAAGKRAQCQGGAKNAVVILPDANPQATVRIIADGAFGCAGQRCLATSLVLGVAGAGKTFLEAFAEEAARRRVGNGLDDGIEMGPVISHESLRRIEALIDVGKKEGARVLVDGRGKTVRAHETGNFVFPTLLDNVAMDGELARTEIFGPVLSWRAVSNLDEAIDLLNRSSYGNMACLFTADGAAARRFRSRVQAGNVGINIGVAAPMSHFPFSGFKQSFFGDLHAQSRHAVEFYTQTKVVVERWGVEWSRKF